MSADGAGSRSSILTADATRIDAPSARKTTRLRDDPIASHAAGQPPSHPDGVEASSTPMVEAWRTWAASALAVPIRLMAIMTDACASASQIGAYAVNPDPARADIAPLRPSGDDQRFRDPAWRSAPFDVLVQLQLARERAWEKALRPLPGISRRHLQSASVLGRPAIQAIAPTNFTWSNPQAISAARRSGGRSIVEGIWNLAGDALKYSTGRDPRDDGRIRVGRDVAVTPGKVVLQNHLIELIQYAPRTSQVRSEPILIVPAWIMKYYILDLSPANSLIHYLVNQGFTVFCISWRNPDAADRDLAFDDYRTLGVMAALDAVTSIIPRQQIHAVGYCVGGTILATAAAAMARDGDDRLGTLTLFAAQTEFSEAGELLSFLGEQQLPALETVMHAQGYLDSRQMASAFSSLRADDLIWGPFVARYLLGQRRSPTDMDAWFRDGTRLPAVMHAQYLRWFYLENRLATGRLNAGGGVVTLKRLRMPLFIVGAERDHIAPWRSVYRTARLASAETTFILSGGGHNSAIVSPPGKSRAYYRIRQDSRDGGVEDIDAWATEAPSQPGSWWPEWIGWLDEHGSGDRVPIRCLDANSTELTAAPGSYVLMR